MLKNGIVLKKKHLIIGLAVIVVVILMFAMNGNSKNAVAGSYKSSYAENQYLILNKEGTAIYNNGTRGIIDPFEGTWKKSGNEYIINTSGYDLTAKLDASGNLLVSYGNDWNNRLFIKQ